MRVINSQNCTVFKRLKDTTEVVTRIETTPEKSDDFRLFARCGAKGFVVSEQMFDSFYPPLHFQGFAKNPGHF